MKQQFWDFLYNTLKRVPVEFGSQVAICAFASFREPESSEKGTDIMYVEEVTGWTLSVVNTNQSI